MKYEYEMEKLIESKQANQVVSSFGVFDIP